MGNEVAKKYKIEISSLDLEFKGHKNKDRKPPVEKVIEHDCSPLFEMPCPIHSREKINKHLPEMGAKYSRTQNENITAMIREEEELKDFVEITKPQHVKRLWGKGEKTNYMSLGVSFYFVWKYSVLTDLLLTKRDSRADLMKLKNDFINQIDEGDQLLIVKEAQKCGSKQRKIEDPMWGERGDQSEKSYNFFSLRKVMSEFGDVHTGTDTGQTYEYIRLGHVKLTTTATGSKCAIKRDPVIHNLSIAAIKHISEQKFGYEWDGLKLKKARDGKKPVKAKKPTTKATKPTTEAIEEPNI